MKIKTTEFPGLVELLPSKHADNRGTFMEVYNEQVCFEHYLPTKFVQDNESYSTQGVLRGLHFQKPPFAQGKLVRVIQGSVLDIVIDLRKGSPTFRKPYSVVLDGYQKNMLFVPAGFAHGFLALTDAIFHYKCTAFYHKEAECGIRWNDPILSNIWENLLEWPGTCSQLISEKDQQLPSLEEALELIEKAPDSNGQFVFHP